MPFCTNCGTEVNEGESFCSNCGKQLGESKQSRKALSKPIGLNRRFFIILSVVLVLIIAGAALISSDFFDSTERQIKSSYKLLNEGKYEEAILAFEKAIEIQPRNTRAYAGLGLAYAQTGEYDKALETFETTFDLGLDNPELLHEDVVNTYLLQGDINGAIGHIKSIDDHDVLEYLEKEFSGLFETIEMETVVETDLEEYLPYFSPYIQPPNEVLVVVKKCFEGVPHLVGIAYDMNSIENSCTEVIVLQKNSNGYELKYKESMIPSFNIHSFYLDSWIHAYAVDTDDKLLIKTTEPYPSDFLHVGRYILLNKDRVLYTSEEEGDFTALEKHEGGDLLARQATVWQRIDINDNGFSFSPIDVKNYIPEFTEEDFVIDVLRFKDVSVEYNPYTYRPKISGKLDFFIRVNGNEITQDSFKYSHSYEDELNNPYEEINVYTYPASYYKSKNKRIVFVNSNSYRLNDFYSTENGAEILRYDHPGWFELQDIKANEVFTIGLRTHNAIYEIKIDVIN
jgi:predicted nucleic acid-binding Zn ribbon protein